MCALIKNEEALEEALLSKILSGKFEVPVSVVWDDLFEKMDAQDFQLHGGSFSCSTFNKCNFRDVYLHETHLEFETFNQCSFENVTFDKCAIEGVKLVNCTNVSLKFI